ncbi:IS630 family transposase [Psychrobacter sp. 1Y1]|uniref:IS630 family transposase n=1 Tax=Psychrobacter sp. 1Y1 TaxID=3453574 RepID=UPI003F445506
MKTILKIPGYLPLDRIDIWFQDEARFGQQNTTTKIWARKGSRPRVVRQQQFEYAYLFGSVCPSRGIGQAIVVPWTSKEAMSLHLRQISEATDIDRHAVVLMDGAGWHSDGIADEFKNVSIIKLPPYSPELNSIEQVWSWMRQHCLANRVFKNYEDIVDSVCEAWNTFTESSERVTKLCSRDWASVTS